MSKNISLTQKTIDYLISYIKSDNVKIGDKLATEQEVCNALSVGRGTVREAFRNLEAQGFVELIPGRGAFIIKKSENENEALLNWFGRNRVKLNDYIEVRSALEPAAIVLAANRCTDDELKELKSIHNTFINAVEARDVAKIAAFDEKFHTHIMKMTKNKMFMFINDRINERISTFRAQTFKIEHNSRNAVTAHENILNALLAKDAEVAKMYMERHIDLINFDMDNISL